MSIIIPDLLPETKLYGLYGPGFQYSLIGGITLNPILASSYGGYSPSISCCLNITTEHNIYADDGFIKLSIIINTSAGAFKKSIIRFSADGSIVDCCGGDSTVYPETTIPDDFCIIGIYYGFGVKINIFNMLRNGAEVYDIMILREYKIGSDGGTLSGTSHFGGHVYYKWSTDSHIYTDFFIPYDLYENNDIMICRNTLPYYGHLSLNKSTGFVIAPTIVT